MDCWTYPDHDQTWPDMFSPTVCRAKRLVVTRAGLLLLTGIILRTATCLNWAFTSASRLGAGMRDWERAKVAAHRLPPRPHRPRRRRQRRHDYALRRLYHYYSISYRPSVSALAAHRITVSDYLLRRHGDFKPFSLSLSFTIAPRAARSLLRE